MSEETWKTKDEDLWLAFTKSAINRRRLTMLSVARNCLLGMPNLTGYWPSSILSATPVPAYSQPHRSRPLDRSRLDAANCCEMLLLQRSSLVIERSNGRECPSKRRSRERKGEREREKKGTTPTLLQQWNSRKTSASLRRVNPSPMNEHLRTTRVFFSPRLRARLLASDNRSRVSRYFPV